MKTKVINLFGGPGVGKSTTASGVFHELKKRDIQAEYVSEYAKDVVWEELNTLLKNQIHVFSEQLRRQWRLINKVNYIVTDSPLLLASIYYRHYWDSQKNPFFDSTHTQKAIEFFDDTFLQFDNINFVITRSKKYQPTGRLQTEEEAKLIDDMVIVKLMDREIPFEIVNYETAVRDILDHLNL